MLYLLKISIKSLHKLTRYLRNLIHGQYFIAIYAEKHTSFACVLSRCRDVMMGAMASQITGVSIVYSTVCLGVDQRKHQSSASLTFVRGINQWRVNSPHKRPVTRKIFPFDDVIIIIWLKWKFVFHFYSLIFVGKRSTFPPKQLMNIRVKPQYKKPTYWFEIPLTIIASPWNFIHNVGITWGVRISRITSPIRNDAIYILHYSTAH